MNIEKIKSSAKSRAEIGENYHNGLMISRIEVKGRAKIARLQRKA